MKPEDLKKALDRIARYNRINDDWDATAGHRYHFGMAQIKRGKWVLFEDVKTVICQVITDAERNDNCQK